MSKTWYGKTYLARATRGMLLYMWPEIEPYGRPESNVPSVAGLAIPSKRP